MITFSFHLNLDANFFFPDNMINIVKYRKKKLYMFYNAQCYTLHNVVLLACMRNVNVCLWKEIQKKIEFFFMYICTLIYVITVLLKEIKDKKTFSFQLRGKTMNSASYEYRNISARRGARFVHIGMPTICWKTFSPNTTRMLSTRNSCMLMMPSSVCILVFRI